MKLYIIGNGFDLNHRLPTSYWNYKDYLVGSNSLVGSNYERSEYLQAAEYGDNTKWNDVEGGLLINYEDAFYDMTSNYYPDMGSERTPGWEDINIEVENRFAFLRDFTGRYFYDWLISIDSLCHQAVLSYILKPSDAYVTFNYTRTLEDVYGIPDANVFHIHGMVGDPESIQFGNPYNNPQEILAELIQRYCGDEFYSVVYDSAITSMRGYAANAYKDIAVNMGRLNAFVGKLLQVGEVIVMGHTLMGVDEPYYEQVLIPLFGSCLWTIYAHTKEDERMVAGFVEKYRIVNYQIFQW